MTPQFLTLSSVLLIPAFAAAAVVSVDSYTHLSSFSSNYPDSGGVEMTNGITDSLTWGGGFSINFAQVSALTGWASVNPSTEFDFGTTATIQQVTVWAADSNSSAGVAYPIGFTIRTPDNSFVHTVSGIPNPAGGGDTKPFIIGGFSVDTDKLIVTTQKSSSSWTMLSEVQFNSTPEPSSALLSIVALGMTLRRRR